MAAMAKNGDAPAAKQARPKMWRAMRVMHKSQGSFCAGMVASLVGAKPSAVLQLVNALIGVGVVRRFVDQTGGGLGRIRYAFTRDLGPRAPVVRRVYSVYDPNSGKELKRQPTRASGVQAGAPDAKEEDV